jgi:uncharacterized damage-inducible protein DinB
MDGSSTLGTIWEGWANHQRLLLDAMADLTPEQVALRPAPGLWTVWQLAGHMAGARMGWFHDVLGEGDRALRDRFRVTNTTVPDLPLADAGWEDDETHPRDAAELVDALEQTWAMIDACLRRWTPQDLAVEFTRTRPSGTRSHSRQWVIWHLIEHDLHHGGEISLILGMHGVPALDL